MSNCIHWDGNFVASTFVLEMEKQLFGHARTYICWISHWKDVCDDEMTYGPRQSGSGQRHDRCYVAFQQTGGDANEKEESQ